MFMRSRLTTGRSGGEAIKAGRRGYPWTILAAALWLALSAAPPAGAEDINGNRNSRIGSGPNDNFHNVTVKTGVTVSVGEGNAISVGSGSNGNRGTITLENDAIVQNNANSGGGLYGTGPNTIEVGHHYDITIGSGAKVLALGRQSNGEAINVHEGGNTITIASGAVVYSSNGAAIWFQDINTEGGRNKVDNSGIIQTGGDYNTNTGQNNSRNVLGTSGGNGIDFTNNTGGKVLGSLKFAQGDDTLTFFEGSEVTGDIDGGGGTNALILNNRDANGYDSLAGAIKNFTSLTKLGPGTWEITGSLEGFTTTDVKEGTLSLTGNNDGYSGALTVDPGAILEARAQSLPSNHPDTGNTQNVINNGTLNLTNGIAPYGAADEGTYVGQIIGAGKVEKTEAGTTNLAPASGANTYSGGTYIKKGTLGVASNEALGDIAGELNIDGGTFRLNGDVTTGARNVSIGDKGGTIDTQSNTGVIDQGITGTGTGTDGLNKTGTGILTLNGENTYKGPTNIYAGSLRVFSNGANNMTGQVHVFGGGRLEGTGTVGSADPAFATTNAGIISPGVRGETTGVLTIRGNLRLEPGGRVEINSILGDDNSATSRLVVQGDTVLTSPDYVTVINHGGSGAVTHDGIKIIEVLGNVSAPNAFRLDAHFTAKDGTPAIVGGAYTYVLNQGTPDGSEKKDWYLQTLLQTPDATNPSFPRPPLPTPLPPNTPTLPPVVHPSTPIYVIYPAVLSEFTYLTNQTMMQRVGQQSWSSGSECFGYVDPSEGVARDDYLENFKRRLQQKGVWARVNGATGKMKADVSSLADIEYGLNTVRAQVGFNYPLFTRPDGSSLMFGGSFNIGHGRANVRSTDGTGKVTTDGIGFTTTLTWLDASGLYADAVGTFTWFDSDIESHVLYAPSQINGNNAFGYLVSLEAGKVISLANGWALTPQAQLTYTNTSFDSFVDAQNVKISNKKSDNLIGRLGLSVNRQRTFLSPAGKERSLEVYGLVNYYYDFRNESEIAVADVRYRNSGEKNWGGVAVGATYEWADAKYAVYGQVGARTTFGNFGDSRIFSGNVGFRINF